MHENIDVLFCVDGSKEIGMGHISRTVRLAKILQNKNPMVKILFLSFLDKTAKEVLDKAGFKFIELKRSLDYNAIKLLLNGLNIKVVAVDRWRTNTKEYLQILKTNSEQIIVFDDDRNGPFFADFLINSLPNTYLKTEKNIRAKLLQGPEYLIMPEIDESPERMHRDLLVVLGGSDYRDYSLKISEEIAKRRHDLKITCLSAGGKTDLENLSVIKPFSRPLHKMMKSHSIVLTSGAMTMLEAIYLKKPTFAYAALSWEIKNIKFFEEKRVVRYIGSYRKSPEKLAEAFLKGLKFLNNFDLNKNAIDGKGPERLNKKIFKF